MGFKGHCRKFQVILCPFQSASRDFRGVLESLMSLRAISGSFRSFRGASGGFSRSHVISGEFERVLEGFEAVSKALPGLSWDLGHFKR